MDPAAIRRVAITAVFADDILMDRLVLKGGNALDLVHGLSARGSYDVDFSIEGDFDDVNDVRERLERSLVDRFDAVGLYVFDQRFEAKPTVRRQGMDERWGGYLVEFKLIERAKVRALGGDLEALRRDATVLGTGQRRTFRIEISKHEYVEGKQQKELDAFLVYVYSPEMIAAEKLRAICQQMPQYPLNPNRHPRARDFYDICTIVSRTGLDLSTATNLDLIRAVFAAKGVPLELLAQVCDQRSYHAADWPSVVEALHERPLPFDHYFDSVVKVVEKLESLWDV